MGSLTSPHVRDYVLAGLASACLSIPDESLEHAVSHFRGIVEAECQGVTLDAAGRVADLLKKHDSIIQKLINRAGLTLESRAKELLPYLL